MNSQSEKELKKFKLAKRFYRLHLKDNHFSYRNIINSLHALSLKVRPDVWRTYRNAVSFHANYLEHDDFAARVKDLFNPTTIKADDKRIAGHEAILPLIGMQPKKEKLCKKVTEQDHDKIIQYLIKNEDPAIRGAVLLAYLTGMRPAEMLEIELIPEQNAIFIKTAKELENGERGLDREHIFSNADYKIIEQANYAVQSEKQRLNRSGVICDPSRTMKRIQNRLAKITKTLFPNQKYRITLYSYRHQMGSNLKASGFDHVTVAAIMGHRSVDSVDSYGNAKNSTRMPSLMVSEESKAGVRQREKRTIDGALSNTKKAKTPLL